MADYNTPVERFVTLLWENMIATQWFRDDVNQYFCQQKDLTMSYW